MRRTASIVTLAAAVLLMAGCAAPDYGLACYDNQPDRMSAKECRSAADAAVADAAGTPSAVAVWSFIECFPGAYCPLLSQPAPASQPLTAVAAIRFEDGTSEVRIVHGVSSWRPSTEPVVGVPGDLVTAIFNTNGAMISP